MRLVKKLAVIAAAMWALVWSLPGFANSTVNIAVWTSTENKALITEVEILGPGGGLFAFADPYTAPDLTDSNIALAEALVGLALSPDTALGGIMNVLIGTDQTLGQTLISNYNPVDHPHMVLGDPDDWLTWIAIGDEDVEVEVFLVTTYYDFHRLTASILQATDVPAPASSLLFLMALLGMGTMRLCRQRCS